MKKYLPAIIISLVVLAVVGFVFFALKTPDKNNDSNIKNQSVSEGDKKILSQGWSRGNGQAKIVLTEFGDFQCPACKQFESSVSSIEKDFEGKINFVFKQFPLVNIHKNALTAALAAEAAGDQGKFWQMYDILYEKQNEWAESNNPLDKFADYAKQIGIDADKLKKDVESKKFEDKINADIDLGNKFSINGTPSFFVNGAQVDISSSGAEGLRKSIQDALSQ